MLKVDNKCRRCFHRHCSREKQRKTVTTWSDEIHDGGVQCGDALPHHGEEGGVGELRLPAHQPSHWLAQ